MFQALKCIAWALNAISFFSSAQPHYPTPPPFHPFTRADASCGYSASSNTYETLKLGLRRVDRNTGKKHTLGERHGFTGQSLINGIDET